MKKYNFMLLGILLVTVNVFAESNNVDVMSADANHDGKVTFEEFKAANDAELLKQFKAKDINQDGVIDLQEKQVAQAQINVEKQAQQDADAKSLREKYDKDRATRKKHFYKFE
jgi:hypothetical protein